MPCPLVSRPSTLPVTKISTEPLFSLITVRDVDDREEPGSIFMYDSFEPDEGCCDCSCVRVEPRLKTLRTLWRILVRDILPTRKRKLGRHAAMSARPPSIRDQ